MADPIRHFSIDFWSTLYRPDPRFSELRVEWIVQSFTQLDLDRVALRNCIKEVGRLNDELTDSQGISRGQTELYEQVFSRMGISVSVEQLHSICIELDRLFLENRPVLIDAGYADLLERLSSSGCTLSISSNTAFVTGRSLAQCLQLDGLAGNFTFMVFSDQIGCSKPARAFFERVHKQVNSIHGGALPGDQVLHVGDNLLADIKGAGLYGFRTLHVASPPDLYKMENHV